MHYIFPLTKVHQVSVEGKGVGRKGPGGDVRDWGEGADPHHGQAVAQGDSPTQI